MKNNNIKEKLKQHIESNYVSNEYYDYMMS